MANEDNTNQRLKRPVLSAATRRPSSPAFNGKQAASKRSMATDNNNNDLTPNLDESCATKRFKQDEANPSTTKVDASVQTVSVGLATEPDQLGPCEPGTSVVLEGIVWNETDSGVLVVNVTWRGKTYVGTLLDSTKQDWACPRLLCESPTSDYDARHSSKTSRSKRGNYRCLNSHSLAQLSSHVLASSGDDRKLRNSLRSRQSKRSALSAPDDGNASPLTSPFRAHTTFFPASTADGQLIPCPESQCHKQFVSAVALNYHLSNAHKKNDSNSSATVPQANTRDEEDVAHILANVADYVRRPSPRSSPEHHRQTSLTWPCPQISSNLVLSSPLVNNEQAAVPLPANATRCSVNSVAHDDAGKPADRFLLHMPGEAPTWTNEDEKTVKIPTPPPSSFVPITVAPAILPPPASSSPAYSDISDEDASNATPADMQSTSALAAKGKLDDNGQSAVSNGSWTPALLLQPYGNFMHQATANK